MFVNTFPAVLWFLCSLCSDGVQEWAGNGAMVGAIKGCTGVEPTIVGKPSPLMIDYIVDKYSVERCGCSPCRLLYHHRHRLPYRITRVITTPQGWVSEAIFSKGRGTYV